MKLGVIMTTGDLLYIFFLAGCLDEAFAGIGNDEGFVGVGDKKGFSGSGEE